MQGNASTINRQEYTCRGGRLKMKEDTGRISRSPGYSSLLLLVPEHKYVLYFQTNTGPIERAEDTNIQVAMPIAYRESRPLIQAYRRLICLFLPGTCQLLQYYYTLYSNSESNVVC